MRLRIIRTIIVFCVAVLVFSLWYIQCVQRSRYMELSERNRIRLIPLVAPRGNLYDRKGDLLAGSRLAFDCTIIPQEFKADEEQLEQLSLMLQVPSDSLKKKIRDNAKAPFISVTLKKDIGKETAIIISERGVEFPGLLIHTYPTRYYPNGSVGSHIAGYIGRISGPELDALRDYGYKGMDFVGRSGLEFNYDNYLKGEEGGMQIEVDSRGRELKVLGIKEPEKGRDITLTIDLELERYIDSLLEGYRGAIIVMNSESGEILGLVSKPDFDPNIFASSSDSGVIKNLLRRRDYPFINRAVSGTYPPGSAFKIVTASAALESKKIGAKEKLNCNGFYFVGNRRFNCWRKSGHNLQTMREGIKNSCNVFFYQAGRRAGVDALSDYAFRYGFGMPTGIDLPYEADGILPGRAWKKRHKKESWYEGDTVNFAIGQGYLSVTPIQTLKMMNAVATEGKLVKPFLVKKIEDVEIFNPEERQLDISKATFRIIKEGVREAVNGKGGTAKRASVEGLEIAGKTGTAQTGGDQTHAWFAGFSPVKTPKISLVIFLEYGGKGGDKPCRIAAQIFDKLRKLEYL